MNEACKTVLIPLVLPRAQVAAKWLRTLARNSATRHSKGLEVIFANQP